MESTPPTIKPAKQLSSLWVYEYGNAGLEIVEWPRKHCQGQKNPKPCFPKDFP
jgi:hypothetical protein